MNTSVNFAQPDIALRLDTSGIIRKALSSNAIATEGLSAWVGQRWADTVSTGRTEVHQMMDDARLTGVSPLHRVRQRFPSGVVVSVEYTAVRLGTESGFIAIGRNLEVVAGLRLRLISAQTSMARDSWKLRNVATRHRILLDASSQPVMVVDADDLHVREANIAARRSLGVESGADLLPKIVEQEREDFRSMLLRVKEQGEAPGVVVNLGLDRGRWHVRASFVASGQGSVFLLRFSPSGAPSSLSAPGVSTADKSLFDRLRDGVAVLDAEGAIVRANRAFLELVQLTDEHAALGKPLDRWLSHSTIVAEAQAFAQGRGAGALSAKARGELGAEADVELRAVGSTDLVCVLVRRVAPTSPAAAMDEQAMRALIDESVASVERKCFLAALELAKSDPSALRQMLGLAAEVPPSGPRRGTPGDTAGGSR